MKVYLVYDQRPPKTAYGEWCANLVLIGKTLEASAHDAIVEAKRRRWSLYPIVEEAQP